MCQPDNIWAQTWDGAVPLPAYKQKRLFDDTREAEKILRYLEGFRACDLALSLMPVLLHTALVTLEVKQSKYIECHRCRMVWSWFEFFSPSQLKV